MAYSYMLNALAGSILYVQLSKVIFGVSSHLLACTASYK